MTCDGAGSLKPDPFDLLGTQLENTVSHFRESFVSLKFWSQKGQIGQSLQLDVAVYVGFHDDALYIDFLVDVW